MNPTWSAIPLMLWFTIKLIWPSAGVAGFDSSFLASTTDSHTSKVGSEVQL
jgi:hypothetical protein